MAVLLVHVGVTTASLLGGEPTHLVAYHAGLLLFFNTCLAWLLLHPASWRRWRTPAVTVQRAALLPGALLLASSQSGRLGKQSLSAGGSSFAAQAYFAAALALGSGTLALLPVSA